MPFFVLTSSAIENYRIEYFNRDAFLSFHGNLLKFSPVGIFKFARHYFCRDLEEKGRKYIRHHFKRILQESPEFKELTSKELEAILRDDELNVKNEEIVFEAVKTWIEHNVDERRPYLPRLLKCMRYGLMSYNFFTNNVLTWKIIEEDEVSVLCTIDRSFKPRKKQEPLFFYRTNEFIIFSGNYFYNYRFLLFAPVITSPVSFHFLNEFHANESIEYNLIIYIRIIRNTDLCFYSFQYLHYELSFHYLYLVVKNNFYTKRIYFDVAKLHG